MKIILICEGPRDGEFLKNIFDKLSIENPKFFLQKNVSLPEKKDAETKIIRSFIEPYSPYKILVKQEGGKDSATKIFAKELQKFLTYIDKFILLLDRDHCTSEEKISLLQKIIDSSYGRTTPLTLDFKLIKSNNNLYHYSCDVKNKKSGLVLGEFQIIFFKISLEHSCNITKKDSRKTIISKIKKFVEQEKISNFFVEILVSRQTQ